MTQFAVTLTPLHFLYLIGVITILTTMILRKDSIPRDADKKCHPAVFARNVSIKVRQIAEEGRGSQENAGFPG